MTPNLTLLDLLLEVQVLDRVPRMGYVLRGVSRPESVAEHSWHVAFLVATLAPRIPEVNGPRALEMALLHDLAELRIGDLPRTVARYFPEGAKETAETAALDEILAPLPARSRELLADYRARISPEARLVKACDKLQLMIKVHEYQRWGEGALSEFWGNSENFGDEGFASVGELFQQLRERAALANSGRNR
jgi:putative hydrolases of HD superfamily